MAGFIAPPSDSLRNGGGIIDMLVKKQQQRQENTRLGIEQQKVDNENEHWQDQVQAAKDAHDEVVAQHKTENDHNTLIFKAQEAQRKFNQAKELQEMAEKSNASGVPIPGATVNSPLATPATSDAPGVPALGLPPVQTGVPSQQVQPGTQTFENTTLPFDPDAYRQRSIDNLNATAGPDSPAARAKIAESVALQNAMQDRIIEQNRQNRQAASDLQDNKNDAAMLRTRFQQNQENYRASLKIKAGVDNFDPAPHVAGALNGTESQEEINKLGKNEKQVVTDQMSQLGIQAPTAKQVQFMQGLGGAIQTIPKMEEYDQLLKSHSLNARVPGTDDYARRSALETQIREGLTQATGPMTASTRLSKQRIDNMVEAFTPTANPLHSSENKNKPRDFTENLNAIVDDALSNLSPAQRQHLKETSGLSQYVDKYVTPPVAPAATPKPAAVAPSKPSVVQWGRDKDGNPVPISQ